MFEKKLEIQIGVKAVLKVEKLANKNLVSKYNIKHEKVHSNQRKN